MRKKQRIFHGYDAFVNLLASQVDTGVLQLRNIVEAYRGLNSILHRGARQEALDLDALSYVMPRLPMNITSALSLYLAEDLPDMYRPVREAIRAASHRAKKREFYEVLPNKFLVLLRDRMTDIVDLITKLCIYAVEIGKIRDRLLDSPLATEIARLTISGCTPEEAEEFIRVLPFTETEIAQLNQFYGQNLLQRLYELMVQVGDISIYVEQANHRYAATVSERWLSQLRKAVADIVPAEEFNHLDVHLVSSNTHSVHNCLSPWLHEHADMILRWASETWPDDYNLTNPADRLYLALRAWASLHRSEMKHRLKSDRTYGIHVLDDPIFTGIPVILIEANRLSQRIDPDIGPPGLLHRTLIVNMDYAYGQQAELIMHNLILLFGQRIRTISVFGKSGAVVGQRGDLLLPNRLLLQTDDQLSQIPNRDLTPADFLAIGCDRPIHQGTMLTVLGTVMQNREMLHYYRHFWNVIGMEMEGSFYLREILRARSLGLIPEDVQLRFAYYTSDTPLEPGASLASGLTAAEGLPPVYAITRAVLRRILVTGGN